MIKNFETVSNDLTYNKKKSYNVILNSAGESETNKGEIEYYFDWSVLPVDTAFEVYFTFMSNVTTTSSSTSTPCVYIELGDTNTFEPSSTQICARKSSFLGTLCLNGIGSNTFFRTDETQNPPIYLHTRPKTNQFKVQIYKSSATPWNSSSPQLWTNEQATPANMPNYVLTLKFYPIEI